MYYSEVFFKKDIYNINEDDVLQFFSNSPEESSILEFKSGDNLDIQKVYPEVCALHNTQGGLIIIGSPKPRKDEGREFFDGELTRTPFKDKDWVYQKISSNISPAPSGLKIHDVKMSDSKYVQIIDVPKSLHPPHQCLLNGIYYLRFETQSRFAPHGLVEAMFNRVQEPTMLTMLTRLKFSPHQPSLVELQITNDSDFPILGVNGIIKFYNIDKCSKNKSPGGGLVSLSKDEYNRKNIIAFTDQIKKQETIVVKGIASIHKYYVTTGMHPFIIELLVWSSNMNLRKVGYIVFPSRNKAKRFYISEDFLSDTKNIIKQYIDEEEDDIILENLKDLLIQFERK